MNPPAPDWRVLVWKLGFYNEHERAPKYEDIPSEIKSIVGNSIHECLKYRDLMDKKWPDRTYQEHPGAALGIDEGGLEIRVFNPDTGDWYVGYELGGIPEEFEGDMEEPNGDGLNYKKYLDNLDEESDEGMCEYVHYEVNRVESRPILRALWYTHATPEERLEVGDEGSCDGDHALYRGYLIACSRIIRYIREHRDDLYGNPLKPEIQESKGPADDGLDYQTYLSEFEGGTYQQMCEYVHAEVDRCESWYVLRDLWNLHATPEEKEEFGDEIVSKDPDANARYRGYMIACCRIIDYLRANVKLEDD